MNFSNNYRLFQNLATVSRSHYPGLVPVVPNPTEMDPNPFPDGRTQFPANIPNSNFRQDEWCLTDLLPPQSQGQGQGQINISQESEPPEQNPNLEKRNQNENTCKTCGKTFTAFSSLQRHEYSHQGNPQRFACDVCGAKFTQKPSLVTHKKRFHEREFNFPCQHCDKKFVRNVELSKHMAAHHRERDPNRDPKEPVGPRLKFPCTKCDRIYSSKHTLSAHLKYVHSKDGIVCKICNASFTFTFSLKSHISKIHFDEKKYVSKFCGRKFYDACDRNKHDRKHKEKGICTKERTRKRSLRCDLCPAILTREYLLFKHKKEKHPEPKITVKKMLVRDISMNKVKVNPGSSTSSGLGLVELRPENLTRDGFWFLCLKCGHGYSDENRARRHHNFCEKNLKSCLNVGNQHSEISASAKEIEEITANTDAKNQETKKCDKKGEKSKPKTKNCEKTEEESHPLVKEKSAVADTSTITCADADNDSSFDDFMDTYDLAQDGEDDNGLDLGQPLNLPESLPPPPKPKRPLCPELSVVTPWEEEHLNIILTEEKPFQCKTCLKFYSSKKCHYAHVNAIHSGRKFVCEFCGQACNFKSALKTHMRLIHTKEKPFKCEKCDFRTGDQSYLSIHRKTHIPAEMLKKKVAKIQTCSICGKTFKNKISFREHVNVKHIHVNEDGSAKMVQPYTCSFCGNKFAYSALANLHMRTIHKDLVEAVRMEKPGEKLSYMKFFKIDKTILPPTINQMDEEFGFRIESSDTIGMPTSSRSTLLPATAAKSKAKYSELTL